MALTICFAGWTEPKEETVLTQLSYHFDISLTSATARPPPAPDRGRGRPPLHLGLWSAGGALGLLGSAAALARLPILPASRSRAALPVVEILALAVEGPDHVLEVLLATRQSVLLYHV